MNDAQIKSMSEGYEVTMPKLAFYHPNSKGNGCAIILELHLATKDCDGFILCSFANQMTIGNLMGDNPTYPKFDWENSVAVRLRFDDLARVLQVFRGEVEDISDGRGLVHKDGNIINYIWLRHVIDPIHGYQFAVTQKKNGKETRHNILLSPAESLGLCEAITGSLYLIAFGKPTHGCIGRPVIDHITDVEM